MGIKDRRLEETDDMISKVAEIVQVDDCGRILLPHELQDKIGICPHDKLIAGIRGDAIVLKKRKHSVFDLQRKTVGEGTLKRSLIFERSIDRAGKKDMPV